MAWLWELATVRRLITHVFPQVPPIHSPPPYLDKGQEEETARAVTGTLHSNLVPPPNLPTAKCSPQGKAPGWPGEIPAQS